MTLESVSQTLKDFYPRPGERIKQYVVDTRRENDWERETCPRAQVDEHQHDDDNGETCYAFGGERSWADLGRQRCDTCEALFHKLRDTPAIQAWLAEKAARPPIESDRMKLSDEIAPEWPAMRQSPLFALLKKPHNQEPR